MTHITIKREVLEMVVEAMEGADHIDVDMKAAILALIKRAEDAEAIAFQWQNAAIDVTQKHDALQAEVERQETIVKSWLRANAPGGWIDDMRARVNAMESALKKIVNGRHCPAIGERLSDTEKAVVALDALAPGAAPKGEQE